MRRAKIRCLSCDCNLNDYESTRKYEDGTYVDLCNRCLGKSDLTDIVTIDRPDLQEYEDLGDEIFEDEL